MSSIAAIEDAILAKVGTILGAAIRMRESLGGGWTMEMLNRALQFAPGVYVVFIGGGQVTTGSFPGRFMVYTVTKGAIEANRRQGTPRVIGAYDIVEKLLLHLDGLLVPEIGSLEVTGVENLFRDAMFDMGGSVYGIAVSLPNIPLAPGVATDSLEDFITFAADYDLAPFEAAATHQKWVDEPPDYATGAPDLQDNLQLSEE